MSLGIVIKGPEGLVLAADSRVTLSAQTPQGNIHVNYDNATKLLSFSKPNNYVSAVTYGQAAIGLRTANSFLPEFEANLPNDKCLSVKEFAKQLSSFFTKQWENVMPTEYSGPNMTFVVGGFDKSKPYGHVYQFDIPGHPDLVAQHKNAFGLTWGGQREIVDRLLQGFDERLMGIAKITLKLQEDQTDLLYEALTNNLQMPIPIQAMALQDCVDLAVFFINTTILGQNLTVGIRGVGGPIDVATITRRYGFQFIQKKDITAEKKAN
ncbi:MAG: hypothetical protein GY805_08845 [Chloroflexi bacterium]|nr:hypothetical protein [Chloroflexota bacterium]